MALRSPARHGPRLDANTMRREVRDGLTDRAVPLEAEVTISGSHRDPRDHRRVDSRTVHVELLLANSVGDSPADLNDLRPKHLAIEGVRTFEIADRDHDMVQAHARTIRVAGRRR